MLAAIDLDDTLLDFQTAWERTAFHTLGHAACVHALTPSRLQRYCFSSGDEAAVWHAFDWRYADPLPGAVDAIKRLLWAGWTVFAVTALDGRLRHEREQALAALGIPLPVHCVGWDADKSAHLLCADLYVDDDPVHCERAMEIGVADVFWVGRNYPVQHECHAQRVDTLYDAVAWSLSEYANAPGPWRQAV